MPVDRELAYESLKWVDPAVYRMYCRLIYRGLTDEQIKKDYPNFYKLHLFTLMNDALDELEAKGLIEILNDYESEEVRVRRKDVEV